MASRTSSASKLDDEVIFLDGWPVLYEDDDVEADLGETNPHVLANEILHVCVSAHFVNRPQFQVFSDLNCYYHVPGRKLKRLPYISPDTMVVKPYARLPESISSYEIGKHGPAPVVTMEVLSQRSAQQRDLREKMVLCAKLGIAEYILVDITGRFLPEKIVLKRLRANGSYKDQRDADGGLTSKLGFRITMEADGQIRVANAVSGHAYIRPFEAEERIRQLETEVARLRDLNRNKNRLKNGR
jgi:Uma2 family endonuclease